LGSSTTTRAGFDFFRLWDRSDNHWDSHWVDGNLPVDNRVEHRVTEYNATAMTDQALEYLRGRQGDDKSFLLMVSWNPPHAKMHDPPPDCLARYKDGLPTRPNVRRSEPISTNPTYLGYHGHITAIDREIGRVLKYLEENRLEEDTVVIYSSDHGTGFGENGSGSKPHPFDEAIRVPFLVRWPGHVSAGGRPETPFGTINIYPTLCGLAGIRVPHHCSGGDLSNLLLGQPGPVLKGEVGGELNPVRRSQGALQRTLPSV
jgi:arylsulfatase A-like enzyme